MIWCFARNPWWRSVQDPAKSPIPRQAAATAVAVLACGNQRAWAVLTRRLFLRRRNDDARGGREQGDRREGEEPGDVQVEPVRQAQLEAEHERAGQCSQLQRRLATGEEVRGD